jgi:hypothetical protein
MDIVSLDSIDIIVSYLAVSEYKKINKMFNGLARQTASAIISRYLKKWNGERIAIEIRTDNLLHNYFTHRANNRTVQLVLESKEVNVIKLYYCKALTVTQRQFHTINTIIDEQAAYVADYVFEYINISKVRVEYDMSEVYELDRELREVQNRLHILKVEQKRDTDVETSGIENTFIDKLFLCNYSIESAVSHTENDIYMKTIEYLADRKIRLNSFCDEYIIYCLMEDIMSGVEEAVKQRLRAIAYSSIVARNNNTGIDFNRIVRVVEPEVLITAYPQL